MLGLSMQTQMTVRYISWKMVCKPIGQKKDKESEISTGWNLNLHTAQISALEIYNVSPFIKC